MRSAKTTILCWNPDSDEVALFAWPDTNQLSRHYKRTSLACFSGFSESSFEKRKAQIFIEAMHLIIRDGCSPAAVHNALLGLKEYRDGLAA
jgi:hypothetical protein